MTAYDPRPGAALVPEVLVHLGQSRTQEEIHEWFVEFRAANLAKRASMQRVVLQLAHSAKTALEQSCDHQFEDVCVFCGKEWASLA